MDNSVQMSLLLLRVILKIKNNVLRVLFCCWIISISLCLSLPMFKNTANTSVCSGLFCCLFFFLFFFMGSDSSLISSSSSILGRETSLIEICSLLKSCPFCSEAVTELDGFCDWIICQTIRRRRKQKTKKHFLSKTAGYNNHLVNFIILHKTSNNRKNHGVFLFFFFFVYSWFFFFLVIFVWLVVLRWTRCPPRTGRCYHRQVRQLKQESGNNTQRQGERDTERERERVSHLKPITAQSD